MIAVLLHFRDLRIFVKCTYILVILLNMILLRKIISMWFYIMRIMPL